MEGVMRTNIMKRSFFLSSNNKQATLLLTSPMCKFEITYFKSIAPKCSVNFAKWLISLELQVAPQAFSNAAVKSLFNAVSLKSIARNKSFLSIHFTSFTPEQPILYYVKKQNRWLRTQITYFDAADEENSGPDCQHDEIDTRRNSTN